MLTKDQIRSANDRPREWLPIPEWMPAGQTHDPAIHGVHVVTISAREKEQFESSVSGQAKDSNIRARLAALACRDENGNRIFGDDDAAWLGDKSAGPVSRIFDAALRLNRMAKDDHERSIENF